MNRKQFLKLKTDYNDGHTMLDKIVSVNTNDTTVIGRIYAVHSEVTVLFDDDHNIETFPFSQVDLLDENGEVIVCPPSDMTGRGIEIDDIVAFVLAKDIAIARIKSIISTGAVKATVLMENNAKTKRERDVFINFPDKKAIRLPLSGEALFAWFFNDFDHRNESNFVTDDR